MLVSNLCHQVFGTHKKAAFWQQRGLYSSALPPAPPSSSSSPTAAAFRSVWGATASHPPGILKKMSCHIIMWFADLCPHAQYVWFSMIISVFILSKNLCSCWCHVTKLTCKKIRRLFWRPVLKSVKCKKYVQVKTCYSEACSSSSWFIYNRWKSAFHDINSVQCQFGWHGIFFSIFCHKNVNCFK